MHLKILSTKFRPFCFVRSVCFKPCRIVKTPALLQPTIANCHSRRLWNTDGAVVIRNHSGYELSQWEATLHCNVVSHWLSPYSEGSSGAETSRHTFKQESQLIFFSTWFQLHLAKPTSHVCFDSWYKTYICFGSYGWFEEKVLTTLRVLFVE